MTKDEKYLLEYLDDMAKVYPFNAGVLPSLFKEQDMDVDWETACRVSSTWLVHNAHWYLNKEVPKNFIDEGGFDGL